MPTSMDDLGIEVDLDTEGQEIILAASQHDLPTLRRLLRSTSRDVRDLLDASDADTGTTPLHAAVLACEEDDDEAENEEDAHLHSNGGLETRVTGAEGSAPVNGANPAQSNGRVEAVSDDRGGRDEMMALARTVVRLLLENGAVWNRLDKNNETPGCIARRLGLAELYDMLVDAGVRSEMLLNRLDDYEALSDPDEADETSRTDGDAPGHQPTDSNAVATGNQSTNPNVTSARFLRSPLVLQGDRLLDEDKNAVMMSWESDIMSFSADLLARRPGLRVLNIGHGMGVIDTFFQAKSPSSHHIIEAHPSVLTDMWNKGWYDNAVVTVHEGKWQNMVEQLLEEGIVFDAIYFDTFAESYSDFRKFFTESVIGLLAPEGKWGFFNGLGADRQICYDVYGKVVEMDLFEAGFGAEWHDVDVPDLVKDGTWEDVRRSYFALDKYRLPICFFMD